MKTFKDFLAEAEKLVARKNLSKLQKEIDRFFSRFNIQIEFSGHFHKRMNERHLTNIEYVGSIFRRMMEQHPDFFTTLKKRLSQAVIQDAGKNINIPIVIKNLKDRVIIVVKTIIQKTKFQTSDPRIIVKEGKEDENKTVISWIDTTFRDTFAECLHTC